MALTCFPTDKKALNCHHPAFEEIAIWSPVSRLQSRTRPRRRGLGLGLQGIR